MSDIHYFTTLISERKINFNNLLVSQPFQQANLIPLMRSLIGTISWNPAAIKEKAKDSEIKKQGELLCELAEILSALTQKNQEKFTQFLEIGKDIIEQSQIFSRNKNTSLLNIFNQLKSFKPDENLLLFLFKHSHSFHNYQVFELGLFLESFFDKQNKTSMLEIVQYNGSALKYVSKELQADKGFVLAAVKQNGLALAYASIELQADKDVVLAAVKQDRRALKYASKELQADKDVLSLINKN